MGIVLQFQALKLNKAGSISMSSSRAARVRTKKWPLGTNPAAFHMDTAGALSPQRLATEVVPPSVSTSLSTEQIIGAISSVSLKVSSLKVPEIEISGDSKFHTGNMPTSSTQIAFRLSLILPAVNYAGVNGFRHHRRIAEAIGVGENLWSMYRSGEAKIATDAACRLRDAFGVTLDWIYCGDITSIRDERVRLAILRAEREAMSKTQHKSG